MTRAVESIADQLFYSTVYIEAEGSQGTWTGTGFLVNYEVAVGTVPVLVTNKHVLNGATAVAFRVVTAEGNLPSSRASRMVVADFSIDSWLGHPDPEVDVAVLLFGPITREMESMGAPGFTRAFPSELLLTREQANDLDAIEQVTFMGYPNGLFDTNSWLPIARRGQTATPIYNDYRGKPALLIDASVFPGSSGSPVFIFDRGMYATRDGSAMAGMRLLLIGVVAAVHTREVRGEIVMTSAHPHAAFSEVIDLGIVYKSSAIQECVDLLFARAGVGPVAGPEADDLA